MFLSRYTCDISPGCKVPMIESIIISTDTSTTTNTVVSYFIAHPNL